MTYKSVSKLQSRREFIRQAACAAVGTAAMTSTIRDLRYMNAAVAQPVSDYKALVCIFLGGGNDSNNLIIPTILSEYNNYAAIRGVVALPQSSALGLADPSNLSQPYRDKDGHNFGLHPACLNLQTLFQNRKLAVLFNTGTLVFPMTRAQYLGGILKKPPQLFSHADQVSQWQTSIPDRPPLTGWGGRCADLLNAVNPSSAISLSVTLAGANTFEVGNILSEYSVGTSGAISLSGLTSSRLNALTNILALPYSNMQAQAYANVSAHAINSGNLLNTGITNTQTGSWSWPVTFPGTITVPNGGGTLSSSLGPQLKMVARLIEAGSRDPSNKNGFGMKRQIFFCSVGGYDLHSGQTTTNNTITGSHASLLAELDQCLWAFQNAIEYIGTVRGDSTFSQHVTAFTASDFSRTCQANGSGTDHGWGSHHLIVGGAVKGGATYGSFPTLTLNGPDDASQSSNGTGGTGRWIPTTAIDQYFATLATWFGIADGNLATVFPNLYRFSKPNLGFI